MYQITNTRVNNKSSPFGLAEHNILYIVPTLITGNNVLFFKYTLLTALGVLDTDTTAVSEVTKLFMCAGFVSTGPITSQND